MSQYPYTQRDRAYVIDNRDGTVTEVVASGRDCSEARARAFKSATEVCEYENSGEGWARFTAHPRVPMWSSRQLRRR